MVDDGDVTVDVVGDLVDADNDGDVTVDVVGDVVVDVGDDGDVTVDDDGVVAGDETGDETGDESPKETALVLLYSSGTHTPRSSLKITGVPLQSAEV